jgi:hypothetical protein
MLHHLVVVVQRLMMLMVVVFSSHHHGGFGAAYSDHFAEDFYYGKEACLLMSFDGRNMRECVVRSAEFCGKAVVLALVVSKCVAVGLHVFVLFKLHHSDF